MNALSLGPLGRGLFLGLSLVALSAVACDDGPDAAPGGGEGGGAGSTTAGSSGSGNTQGGAAGSTFTAASVPTLDAFVAAYAPADCASQQRCCVAGGAQARSDCSARLEAEIRQELKKEELPAGIAYSPEGGAACLNALAATKCSDPTNRGGDACQDVFRTSAYRTRAAGETCIVDGDCVQPAGTYAQCTDVCVVSPIAATGAACDEGSPGGAGCEYPDLCSNGVCVTQPASNAPTGAACTSAANCDSGICTAGGACAAPADDLYCQ